MEEKTKVTRKTFVIEHKPFKMDYLVVGTQLPFDVYTKDKSTYQLAYPKGHKYSQIDRGTLRGKGISEVYVNEDQITEVNRYKKKHEDVTAPVSPEKKFEKYTNDKEKSYYIGKKPLIPGQKITFSLFAIRNVELQNVLTADEAAPAEITAEHIDAAGDIVINKSDIRHYLGYINRLIKSEGLLPSEAAMVRNLAIIENFKVMIDFLMSSPGNKEIIARIRSSIAALVNMVAEHPEKAPDMLSKGLNNYFVNVHSVNVAIMATALGLDLGLKPKDLHNLALGAMLHDIGMSIVPAAIINKMGNLSEQEYKVLQCHVIEGEKLLKSDKTLPDEVVIPATQHHEKLSKRGYPFRLSAEKISLFGRITAICDSYDSLTTRKPYKDPLTSFEAMALLAKETEHYDPSLIKKFIGMMSIMR